MGKRQISKPTSKKTTIINFILIVIIFIGLFIYMISVDGIDSIIDLLINADIKWVLGGVLCILFFWFCEGLTLHLPLKKLYPEQKFSESLRISMIGQLFNNITPFFRTRKNLIKKRFF